MSNLPQQDPDNDDRELDKLTQSKARVLFFWKELSLLLLAILTPIVVLIIWGDPDSFQASGSIVVFLSVLSEFLLLNKQNAKHISNSARAARGDTPILFSKTLTNISYISLIVAAAGTIIWGYGNKFI
jgi:hypothetical protein